MISEHELLYEIEKCQNASPTYTSIGKLADLYTVHDHMYKTPEPNYSGRTAEIINASGDTEFLKTVNRAGIDKAWNVMDELMTVLKISHPVLYSSVIQKLDE